MISRLKTIRYIQRNPLRPICYWHILLRNYWHNLLRNCATLEYKLTKFQDCHWNSKEVSVKLNLNCRMCRCFWCLSYAEYNFSLWYFSLHTEPMMLNKILEETKIFKVWAYNRETKSKNSESCVQGYIVTFCYII